MNRTRIQNRCLAICTMLMAMLLSSVGVKAQNVTIKATNGSTIAAIKSGTTDTFFGAGGFATWQHEQLCMVLTTSDGTALTPNNQLDNPANNLFTSGNFMQIGKGQHPGNETQAPANVCYVSLSLPSGYRFTGYEIKFKKSTETKGSGDGAISFDSPVTSRFGETGSNFSTYTTQADVTNGGSSVTISRTEGSGGSMGNVLYFKLTNTTTDAGEEGHWERINGRRVWVEGRDANNRALITIESAEFFFTAEENYAPVTPAGEITSPVSAVDIPFSTSKVDYGEITKRKYTINGKDYERMSYNSADVADLEANFILYEAESYKPATASQTFDGTVGQVVDYKAGSISSNGGYFQLGSGDNDVEQVYYIESPTYVTLSDGTKNPIGYRIVGAEFEYNIGSIAQEGFYIVGTINNTKYYLNTGGKFTSTPVPWVIDKDGYISSNGLYLYWNNGYCATQSTKPDSGERFTIASNGRIYQTEYTSYYIRIYQQNGTNYGLISRDNYGSYATKEDLPAITTGNFTLNIYDKTGETPHTIDVAGHGKYEIPELMNNDAVKFGVKGTGLVRATLTLQALDPYLNSMSVVCQDQEVPAIRLEQTFTASDFSVSGGVFHFFLPTESEGHNVAITFEDLNSKYFDETYTGGNASHTSRINFVKSDHYNEFGTSNNNIYNDRSEAEDAEEDRLTVGIVGTEPFRFNNAAEVGAEGGEGGVLTEYPFTLEKYAAAPNYGEFGDMTFKVSPVDQEDTRYVFTTDETRYNIAPTTATQHRAYAFYEMEVHVQTATYEPTVKFVKVYNKTFYSDAGSDKEDAFYGVEVTAKDGDGNDGYASTVAIYNKINKILTETKVDDAGNTDLPTSQKQILYLDLSKLKGMYMITDATHTDLSDFMKSNAVNCLLFLPLGSTAEVDNVAYKMESGSFHSANNIIITDKQPFYSPYDIQVDGANYALYTRKKSKPSYADAEYATIIMPFTIRLENGQHTEDGYGTLEFLQMNATNAVNAQPNDNYGTTFFKTTSDKQVEANTPYALKIVSRGELSQESFTLKQNGSNIVKTPDAAKNGFFSAKVITSTGTLDGTSYTFSHKGLFNGAKIEKEKGVFYFANNGFYSSAALSNRYKTADVYPFRSIYVPNTTTSLAKFGFFNIFEGENPNFGGIATGIKDINSKMSSILLGKGTITIKADADNIYRIVTAGGQVMKNVELSAGESITINVPAGVYLVNGTKVFVQ